MINFDIIDTGIGIPLVEHERIFNIFVQAEETTAKRFGGTGLGLALSRRLAGLLGGSLELLESEPSKGSTFRFSVKDSPEMLVAPAKRAASPNSVKLTSDLLLGLKVLVVDDSPDNQLLVKQYLSKYGADIETASNGLEGYKKATEQTFDIVLMDLQMPEMDGYAATQQLRSHGYNRPIIALTADAMSEVQSRSVQAGCNAYLLKPINAKNLIAMVYEHTRMR